MFAYVGHFYVANA